MSSAIRSFASLDQVLRRGRVQARRAARQFQRRASSSLAMDASAAAGGAKRMSFLEWYSAQLDASPLMTKCITSGLIAATGDVLCQAVVPAEADAEAESESGKAKSFLSSWDYWRTARFAAVGTLWVAPAVHYWYGFLTHRLLPGAATPMRIAQRVAADQFAFGPLFTSAFLGIVWLLEGRWQEDAKKTLTTLTDTMPGVLQTGWTVWIPAMTINFGFVPFKYQVLYSNVLSLFWNAYLSYMSSASEATSKVEVVESPASSSSSYAAAAAAEPVGLIRSAAALLSEADAASAAASAPAAAVAAVAGK